MACAAFLVALLITAGCPGPRAPAAPASAPATDHARARQRMVRTQIEARGVTDPAVLEAMRRVPRHRFVRPGDVDRAHADHPLPIDHDQTISQPYIVALMTELARVGPGQRVLEVGTGSGYQAAVLAELGCQVYSVEIVEPLAREAETRLRSLGYERVQVRAVDGYAGWPELAPFDAIVVTAAPPAVPEPLRQQLRVGGRLVIPVGRGEQDLRVITRTASGFDERSVLPVLFVPMTGRAQRGP